MQTTAYEGHFDNGCFYVAGKAVRIPEKRRIFMAILEDTPAESTKPLIDEKQVAAQNFLRAVQNLRKSGFSSEDDEALAELRKGTFKPTFEKRL